MTVPGGEWRKAEAFSRPSLRRGRKTPRRLSLVACLSILYRLSLFAFRSTRRFGVLGQLQSHNVVVRRRGNIASHLTQRNRMTGIANSSRLASSYIPCTLESPRVFSSRRHKSQIETQTKSYDVAEHDEDCDRRIRIPTRSLREECLLRKRRDL